MKQLSVAARWMFVGAISFLAFAILTSAIVAAQQGQNAVYSGGSPINSPDFIDASMYASNVSSPNICTVLNYVLVNVVSVKYPNGAVIDARGLPGTTSTSMTCTGTPWTGITSALPSTILLPGGTILIPSTWIVPANTHLIGEGDGVPTSSFIPATTIQAASSVSGSMIQFGSSSATGISVEALTLDGQGFTGNGITNQYSQDLTYVDHVTLYQIRGIGLEVETGATNSGPYSNITFDLGSYSGTTSTVCAQILSVSGGTRGIHGLSCISPDNDSPAAVLLDSSNNSISDVNISGFYDGIRIGANDVAQSNVLINIVGDSIPITIGTTPVNTIHISSAHTVSDLSIMGVTRSGTNTYTIQDDQTSVHLSDTSIGIYALGDSPSPGVYSRFTTSPNVPTWGVGTSSPNTGVNCTRGSLYSCTGGSSSCLNSGTSYGLWACGLSSGNPRWLPVL